MRGLFEILVVAASYLAIIRGLPFEYSGAIGVVGAVVMATILLHLRGENWRTLGFRLPSSAKSFWLGAGLVVLIFLSIPISAFLGGAVVQLVTGEPPAPDFPALDTPQIYLTYLFLGWTTAAFGEEMLMRGFLLTRFAEVLGDSKLAWVGAAAIQAILFGLMHAYQGFAGIIIVIFFGFTFGLWYMASGRNLLPLIAAHGLIDTLNLSLLYFLGPEVLGMG